VTVGKAAGGGATVCRGALDGALSRGLPARGHSPRERLRRMTTFLDFAARGKVKADIELQPLSAINDIFMRLEHGDVAARVVIEYK